MNRLLKLLPCLLLLAPPARAAQPTTDPAPNATVLVTLKLMKTASAPAELPVRLEFPASCAACQAVDDPAYARQNSREAVLAMRVPLSTALELRVSTDARAFRRVLLETTDLAFAHDANGLSFTLPAQIADRPDSGELQTHLYWQGVELRFEHADPARRAGDYATGEFPAVQRQAAANLEFGLLEAIRRLGLDHYVDDENLGRLFLMGFDTNYPHGHRDSPPHFHLALWLPNYKGTGSMIPHLYLTPEGLISHSLAGAYRAPLGMPLDFQPGKAFTAFDNLGRPVFSLTITPEGWLTLGRLDGQQCALKPVGHGFASGVAVACPSFAPLSVSAEDDLDAATLRESVDGKIAAAWRYDPDCGAPLP
jgi:hypothetical protein